MSLDHLQGLPRQGLPSPQPRWSIGFRKELVEALGGKVKGPTLEELDRVISEEGQGAKGYPLE